MTARLNGQTLPDSWVGTSVGELFQVLGGGTPSTAKSDYWDGDIPWITSADIHGLEDIRPRKAITESAIADSATNLVPSGSIIVVTRVSLGKLGLTKFPLCFSQDSQALLVDDTITEPKYCLYYLSQAVQQFKYSNRGTTISGVTKKQLKEVGFPLPPLNEQHRIVAAIETQFTRLDTAVTALKRSQANLKRYRAAVLKAACEGRLVPTEVELAQAEGRSYEPASVLLERILAERRHKWETENPKKKYQEPVAPDTSELPELPEGWAWASADQICHFITKGTTPNADKLFSGTGEVPFIKVYNLTFNGHLDFSIHPTYVNKETHYGELARSVVSPGDVLMNIVGPPLGKISVVPDMYPEWNINQAVARFRPILDTDRHFLSICLRSESILSWAVKRAKATAGQFNLTLQICRELPLPLPPFAEQQRIVAEVERRLSLIDQLEKTIAADLARANRLRQSILKRAFAGQLVPQDPNDEPAAVLLERIQAAKQEKPVQAALSLA